MRISFLLGGSAPSKNIASLDLVSYMCGAAAGVCRRLHCKAKRPERIQPYNSLLGTIIVTNWRL